MSRYTNRANIRGNNNTHSDTYRNIHSDAVQHTQDVSTHTSTSEWWDANGTVRENIQLRLALISAMYFIEGVIGGDGDRLVTGDVYARYARMAKEEIKGDLGGIMEWVPTHKVQK